MDATIRLGAAAILVTAGALLGRALAAKLRRRAEAIERLSCALKAMGHHMLDRRVPLHQALIEADHPVLADTAEGLLGDPAATPGDCFRRAYRTHAARGGLLDSLTADDEAILFRLFDSLGAGTAQAQRIALEEVGRALEEILAVARKARDEKGKLYASLGVLGGMAVAVLLV